MLGCRRADLLRCVRCNPDREGSMTRRLEAGPLLVTLGALLLLVSLFLNWYTGDITAWEAPIHSSFRAEATGLRAVAAAVPAAGWRTVFRPGLGRSPEALMVAR